MNLIDLAAILPFWCTADSFALPQFAADQAHDGPGAGFLRAARLIRVFRVFKGGRYAIGINMIMGAISMSSRALTILAVCAAVLTVIFSAVIWCAVAAVRREGGARHAAVAWHPAAEMLRVLCA